jgi:hypothetical protein
MFKDQKITENILDDIQVNIYTYSFYLTKKFKLILHTLLIF